MTELWAGENLAPEVGPLIDLSGKRLLLKAALFYD